MQFFAVKLLPGDLGANSLAVLYAVFSLATFMAPACVSKFGVKRCLFFGALGYVTYIASLIYIIPLLVLLCSCFIGVGAALLWTAQAQYMTQNTLVENRGLWTGIFWGLFQMCIIPGTCCPSPCPCPPPAPRTHSRFIWPQAILLPSTSCPTATPPPPPPKANRSTTPKRSGFPAPTPRCSSCCRSRALQDASCFSRCAMLTRSALQQLLLLAVALQPFVFVVAVFR